MRHPTLIVVDDFLADPDAWRTLALQQDYAPDGSKGVRSRQTFRDFPFEPDFCKVLSEVARASVSAGERPALQIAFECIMGARIAKWDYSINGRFQWCGAEDPLVFHADQQEWAGALFLTPYAPVSTGTSLYRSLRNGLATTRGASPDDVDAAFQGALFDRTAWEETDRVGNVYNRLVLWDARRPHAATGYFGTTAETARLFQVFFYDLA